MDTLSDQRYWEESYLQNRMVSTPLPNLQDFREFPVRSMVQLIESVGMEGKSVLEVGAGDSAALLLLAERHVGKAAFTGLDYTDSGCNLLRTRAQGFGLDVNVIHADLFNPKSGIGGFDVVYSIGLVEHFAHLEEVLGALCKFLKPGGVMVSIIPNMHGVLGKLTRRWNRSVYDIHNPHGLQSFLAGHTAAGMKVLRAGYLGSTNFGVLSSCFPQGKTRGWHSYLWLSRLSKALWGFETKCFALPRTAWFSPYIFAVSQSLEDVSHRRAA